MSQLPIQNIINVSVSAGSPGLGVFNTSNLALFTDDAPAPAVQSIGFSGTSASGAFVLTFNGHATASIAWNANLVTIQADIVAVSGLSKVTVSGSIAAGLILSQPGQYGSIPLAVVSTNTLQDSGSVAIVVTPVNSAAGWSGGSLGYAMYITPQQVLLDFGSSSKTYAMANAIFSQQPNILSGDGQLIIILMQTQIANLSFSGVAASGTFLVTYNANSSAAINWNDTPAQVQAKIQAIPGLSQVQVTGSIIGQSMNIILYGVYGAGLTVSTGTNSLETSGIAPITITETVGTAGETIGAAISRTASLVQYFGILVNESAGTGQVIPSADVAAAAAIVQALVKILFFVSNSSSDLTATTGMVAVNSAAANTQTRINYYGDVVANALNFIAAYAGRMLCVDFSGSNTTLTMQLKQLATISPDPSMTQTIYNQALAAGSDIYVSFGLGAANGSNVSSVVISGANLFSDQVYNRLWIASAIQIAGFNYLAQTTTKIPQTEAGMTGLKASYGAVCQQAVTNQYLAPGAWNSSTVFGNPAQLILNVAQVAYYIYSVPVAQQSQANRAARHAPLVQIAIKEAGGINDSNVLVNVNP